MAKKLQFNHRFRIDVLTGKKNVSGLEQYLQRIADKDFDVAAVPFRLLDRLLNDAPDFDFRQIAPLARFTLGGQPRLLTALLVYLCGGDPCQLGQIIKDDTAHPMTRFEAMGWAVYVTHRAAFPVAGVPIADVFQFWDAATPPADIVAAKQDWQKASPAHVWYDEVRATQYILDGFGVDAAKDFADLWHPAIKSDVFRLYRLVKEGGLYCDADSEPRGQLAAFLRQGGGRVWASSMTNLPNCVAINGFVAAPAQSPFMLGFLDQVLRNIRDAAGRGIFWLSGPGALTSFLYHNGGEYDVGLFSNQFLKSNLFQQFDAPYKQTEQNWRVYEHKLGLDDGPGVKRVLDGL